MYSIYYIGAQNSERIDFCQWPYMVTGGNLFDGEFDAIEVDDRIQGWERKITSKKLNIEIHAVGVSLEQAIDQLENVAEKDVLNTTPGRLYVGSSYMKGWLVGTTKDRWLQDLDSISNELTFKSDYPYWITEEEFRFHKKGSESSEALEWLEFPYDVPYEFSKVRNLQYINNSNYTASGFKMIIYGPCINPLIRIAGHIYELRTTLYDGEYAVIDSSTRYAKDRKIIKVKSDGTEENLFNSKNNESSIWEKIPAGLSIVSWNGAFGFDIILFNERGDTKMDFTLTDVYGQEKGPLEHCGVNMVLGTDNDFQITIQNSLYDKERHGKNCRFFCPDTEYGGLIRNTNPITSDKTVKLTGMTWRGLLNQRAINPAKNAYVYLNGEANMALSTYITKLGMTELFEVSREDSGIILNNYQVPLQTMLLDAFDQALALQDARLEIRYKQGPANGRGYVLLRAVSITDHSSNIELNEDGSVKLNILDYQNGVNHLICLGAGEIEQRQQVDLYAWPDGSIRKEQYYTGIDLIEQYYENTTVDTLAELEEEGRDKFDELKNYKQLKISVDDTDLELGDIVGGRERITNIYMAAPVIRKIVDVTGRGRTSISYKLKGEE